LREVRADRRESLPDIRFLPGARISDRLEYLGLDEEAPMGSAAPP
jgi:hypothetical protein